MLCLLLVSPLAAQPQGGVFASHSSIDSGVAGAGLGQSAVIIQDINFDGVAEVVLGAPHENGVGAVQLQAGGGSSFTMSYLGTSVGGLFGWSVANAGYCSGNSAEDILIGAPGEDGAFVFESASGNTWLTLAGTAGSSFGWSVVELGDINGDGADDFAVGAPNASPGGLAEAGSVFVFSGADGVLLNTFDGVAAGDHFGYALEALNDTSSSLPLGVYGSPAKLLVVGSPDTIQGGHVDVIDALTGVVNFAADGSVSAVGSSFGSALAALSDSDADGIDELAVGAQNFAYGAFAFNVGKVEIFSPGSATRLHSITGDNNYDIFGRQICGADVDGDGRTELVVRSFKSVFGRIEIFSGVDCQLMFEIEGTTEMAGVGTSMAGGGDLTSDGFPDLVLGAPLADTAAGTNAGRAVVYGIHTVLSADTGTFDSPAGGFITFQLNFPAEERFRAYLLLASGGTGPITQDGVIVPLSNDRFLRRMVSGNPMFPGQQGQLDIHGDAQVVFYVPPHMLDVLIGTTMNFAAVSADGGGVRTSSVAVPIEIQ